MKTEKIINNRCKQWTDDEDKLLSKLSTELTNNHALRRPFNTSWEIVLERMVFLNCVPERIKKTQEKNILIKINQFRCIKCGEIYTTTERTKKVAGTWNVCKECHNIMKRKEYADYVQNATPETIVFKRLSVIKNRAKYKKIEYNLTAKDIFDQHEIQKGYCKYSGIPMNWIIDDPCCISIDRIDSSKGYTVDNVVLCCVVVNLIKYNNTTEQLKFIVEKITENSQNF